MIVKERRAVDLVEIIKAEQEFAEETQCFDTAKRLLKLVVPDIDKPSDKLRIGYSHLLPKNNQDIGNDDTYYQLLNLNENDPHFHSLFGNKIFTQLFEPSTEALQQLYNFKIKIKSTDPLMRRDNRCIQLHDFIIEKVSDGDATYWRVYQSWLMIFNLHEWLGMSEGVFNKPEFQKNPTVALNNKLFNLYGQGKPITDVEQVKSFAKELMTECLKFDYARIHHKIISSDPDHQYKTHFASVAMYDISENALSDTEPTQPPPVETEAAEHDDTPEVTEVTRDEALISPFFQNNKNLPPTKDLKKKEIVSSASAQRL